jgi:hypothetical protein
LLRFFVDDDFLSRKAQVPEGGMQELHRISIKANKAKALLSRFMSACHRTFLPTELP